MKRKKKELYNEISNQIAGINTPPEREDNFPTDMLSEAVEQMMDNIQATIVEGKEPRKPS
ncbi:hypothetical protein AB6A23_12095 [Paenibacillus tarimensis]